MDSTTHPLSPGKSILIICCDILCIEHMTRTISSRHKWNTVHSLGYFRFKYGDTSYQFIRPDEIPNVGRIEKYDEIYTCGHVFLKERQMHLLTASLVDLKKWPGYFSKFP